MRLFLGLELEPALVDTIAAETAQLRSQLDRVCPALPVRWTNPANLHITLVFLGEVAEPALAAIVQALGPPFDVRAFDLRLGGFGTFPRSGPLRVIWMGASAGADRVVALHTEVSVRLARVGHVPEARAYTPHLTVARVNEARGSDGRRARDVIKNADASGGVTRVANLTLFRSHLGRGGSTYEALLRVPLLP